MTRTVGNTTRRWLVSIVLAVGLLLGGAAFSAPPVSAANTLHVTSCADSGANTLRNALAAAAAGDTIVFDQNCTITLTTGTLTLAQNVTIDGAGHTVIVDGGCTFSSGACQSGGVTVFGVNSGVTASLSNLTIQHGAGTFVCLISVGVSFTCGGAIGNVGTLSVMNCTLSGNSNGTGFGGGAIYNGGTMTVTNSTITGNTSGSRGGGGIYNPHSGTLAVTNSTITGNIAGGGGGIISDGMLTVTNSTLSGNSAPSGAGGAIEIEQGAPTITNSTISGNTAGAGGGIDVDILGTLTVTNSTITGNTSGGIYTKGMVTVTNSTVSGNTAGTGGGIDDEGNYNVTLTNTIVAGNTASTDSDLNVNFSKSGRFVSGGHNLIGKLEIFGFSITTSDQFGTRAVPLDPLLGTLGANGGPTQTFPLLPGSPAIDAGDDVACALTGTGNVNTLDQRGVTRPQGTHCDIGAFESRGFILTLAGGDNQSAIINTAFTNPLAVTIAPKSAGEPVLGGLVTFTVNPVSGASATLAISPAPINASGQTSVIATANGVKGADTVIASASGATGAPTFHLTNTAPLVSIAVTPATATRKVGQTQGFTATATYADSSTADITSQVTWTSDAIDVVTVDATGKTMAQTPGTAHITATLGAISGQANVTVTPPIPMAINIPAAPQSRPGAATTGGGTPAPAPIPNGPAVPPGSGPAPNPAPTGR